MLISIIAAIADNNGIGNQNKIPWHLRSDMARFRQLTIGHHLVMGRKTFESLPSGGLPGRKIIVLTRRNLSGPGVTVAQTFTEAVRYAREEKRESELFICGGTEVYREALPFADRLYITHVHTRQLQCDTFFPDWNRTEWRISESLRNEADSINLFPATFRLYVRRLPGEDDEE